MTQMSIPQLHQVQAVLAHTPETVRPHDPHVVRQQFGFRPSFSMGARLWYGNGAATVCTIGVRGDIALVLVTLNALDLYDVRMYRVGKTGGAWKATWIAGSEDVYGDALGDTVLDLWEHEVTHP